ncbi:LOW QUALITY PROTEIN: hypothetical protein Bca4012_064510 [Brassica carinata]
MRKPKNKKKANIPDYGTQPPNESGGTSLADTRLPPRLFATDMFLTKGLNIYSSPDLLPFIRNVLRGTPEFETIRKSCFGKLFDLPARQCPVSCKLIHSFLTRQLLCLPKNTLWSVFGGFPFHYGLEEFAPLNNLTLIELEEGCLPPHTSITSLDIRRVEFDSDLVVTPIIPIESQPEPGWGVWTDDEKEDSVIYLEQLIADGYTFNKQMWPGGATSEPLIGKPKTSVKKKPVTIKQSLKSRQPSATKRISSYFKRSSNNSFTNAQLTEIVIQLTKQLKQLRRVMKRRNKRSHGRQSSFHATLPLRKKSYASPHPCQHNNEGDAAMETDELPNKQHDAASEPDELPESLSPIISQYAAQLQRDQIAAPQPVCNSSIHTPTVHVPSDHIDDSVHTSPPGSQMITTTDPPNNDELDDYDEPPRTPVTVQPPWSQLNSVIYDKSEHPNSLEIHHILYHGVRIYDSINPDPPIFDSSIPPASPRRSRLLLSPLPTTPLSSPTKISDNVAGFAVHAATVNAFAATASSNSPPCLGSRSFSPKESVDGVVDLTNVKDTGRHVPTLEENHLAQELSRSPLIPALAVISPLPELEWDLFYNIISQKKNVYHTTPSDLEFSNKLLLELAKPKQWTTTHQMEILIHMVARRYSTILTREKSAFITPLLVSYIQDAWSEFKSCRKRDAFVWDQRLLEIVLQPGKKWMDDIHIIYTPMLWGRSHWVGLAINLDMGYVEILDPLPDLHADRRVKHFMQPLVTILPYLVKKVAMCELTQFSGLKKFVTTRIPDLYINTRSGDCGPVSMKFLEMHALGDPAPSMGGITDKIVDDFRK